MNPVQKALWYVEGHSRAPIALEDIAAACHVSPFHLTRAFAATTGRSLMRYVRARRLSEAARQLAGGADDILAVALDSGYGSHEAFTRAFREQFSMTPEQVRAQGHCHNIPIMEAIAMNSNPAIELAPPRFEKLPERMLAGLTERYNCESPAGIPSQWQRFTPYLGTIRGQVGQLAYGVIYNFDKEGNFDYLCGVEIKGSVELPGELTTLTVPAREYAIFLHRGHVAGVRSTFTAIWNDWVPQSGREVAEAPSLECYGPEFNPQTGLGGFELWIPLKS